MATLAVTALMFAPFGPAAHASSAAAPTAPTASAVPSDASAASIEALAQVDGAPNGVAAQTIDSPGLSDPVLDCWTPRRMRSAIPVDLPRPAAARVAPAAAGAEGQRQVASADSAAPPIEPARTVTTAAAPVATSSGPTGLASASATGTDAATAAVGTGTFSRTVGKVFFTSAKTGQNFVCSGSAVNSSSKRLVSTAGRCVHGGQGGAFHRNWMFAAGYQPGATGDRSSRFTAFKFRTFGDWINFGGTGNRGANSDIAFVTTNVNEVTGRRLVDVVGGNGLSTGGPYAFAATLFGYPTNRQSGQQQFQCRATTRIFTQGSAAAPYSFIAAGGCGFGKGAAGGPWMTGVSSSGQGVIRTVSSLNPPAAPGLIVGPYFRSAVATLFTTANGDAV